MKSPIQIFRAIVITNNFDTVAVKLKKWKIKRRKRFHRHKICCCNWVNKKKKRALAHHCLIFKSLILQMKECTCYGYLPSRHGTRALVKEWECSFGKSGRATGRTRQAYQHPPRNLELLAIAYTSENPNARRLDGQRENASDTAIKRTNCEKYVRGPSSKGTGKQTNIQLSPFRRGVRFLPNSFIGQGLLF